MEGEYGEHAIKILEEDSSCRAYSSWDAYVCSYGSYRSAALVTIERFGKRAYTFPVRCECGKRMRKMRMMGNMNHFICEGCGHYVNGIYGLNVLEAYRNDLSTVVKAGYFGEFASGIILDLKLRDV